jgi:PAS domain S-box-containing protein
MKIKTRLAINAWLSLGVVLLMLLSVFWSSLEIYQKDRNEELVNQMRQVAFERVSLRDDYLLFREERARVQWHAKSEILRGLLASASERFTGGEDKLLLKEAQRDFDVICSLFSKILDTLKREEGASRARFSLDEAESRLIAQVFLKAYALNDSIGRLYELTERAAQTARSREVILIILFVVSGGMTIVFNSASLNKIVMNRVAALDEGVRIIGSGNLDYRIDAQGDDELVDLARASNEMAAKLKESYTSVENLQGEITERKRTEQALRASERKYRELVEHANSIILHWTRDGQITFLNEFGQRFFGYAEAEILGRHVVGTIVPETESTGRDLRPLMDQICLDPLTFVHNINENIRRNGERVWIAWTNKVDFDDQGRVVGILSIGDDITVRRRAEEALQNSEKRYRRLFESAKDGILILDGNTGKVVDVNPFLMGLLGYSHHALCNKHIWEVGLFKDIAASKDAFKILQENEYIRYEDLPLETSDGELIHVEFVSNAYPVDHTKVIQCNIRDITERKQAEKKLHDQNRFLQILIDAIPISVFYKGIDGIYAGCNKAFAQFLGLSKEEIIGKGVYEMFPKDIADIYYQKDVALFHEAGIQQYEAKMNHADGTIHDVLFTKATYEDEDAEVTGLIGAMLDITERKRSEAERERLMAAIEQAGEVIVITDPAGTIQYVNPAFETATGYTIEEAVGQTPRILKSGKHNGAFYRKLWETISSGRTWEGRMVNKRKDGSLYTEVATISPVRDAAGRIVNYVAVKRDITEHLQLADQFQQAQKMESVGRLAGGVAHDFNNMLGIIIGYAEMALSDAGRGTTLHSNLTEIRKAAQRSADLTRQLLTFARKQTIDPKELNLNSTVEGMLNMLRRLIGEDIDLAWLPGPDLWPVKMDPAQVDQILANLCVNARDAIADVGKVTIETQNVSLDEAYCAAHAGFAPGEFVMLTVSDDGCGMDEETQRRLFEPFFTTKQVGKGTGLGLATVYGIVKQNDGFINVYSEPGQGTTFRIYLPRHAAGIVETRAAIAAEIPQGHGETVLLVEDEPAMLNMGKGMLEKLGYTVLTAATPTEAMRLAEEHAGEIHLLMTDVVMPEMNGRDLAHRLKSLYTTLKCLFMSGYTANVIAHHGVLDPGVHFIQKPFSMQGLATKVREVLEKGE